MGRRGFVGVGRLLPASRSIVLLAFLLPWALVADVPQGVVVESVDGWALENAGVQAGDVLFSWRRLPASPANPEAAAGLLQSPFDWLELEAEHGQRGSVVLVGEREGSPISIEVKVGSWDARVRPIVSGHLLDLYLEGKELVDKNEVQEGTDLWRRVAESALENSEWRLRSWIYLEIGKSWTEFGNLDQAISAFESALDHVRRSAAAATVLDFLGKAYEKKREYVEAEASYRRALEIRKASRDLQLSVAVSYNHLGNVAWYQSDLTRAEQLYTQALEVREKLAPGSLVVSKSLYNLGLIAKTRGDLDRAEKIYGRCLEIRKNLSDGPRSRPVAEVLNLLGAVARERGRLGLSYDYHSQALAILEESSVEDSEMAATFNGLGLSARSQGRYELAEEYLTKALSIQQALAPVSSDVSSSLNNLGLVAYDQGLLGRAAEFYRRALAIDEGISPGGLRVAVGYTNMGVVEFRRGAFDVAGSYYHRALEILEIQNRKAPSSLMAAANLGNLGLLEARRGRLERAIRYLDDALDIYKEKAPNSLETATVVNNIGLVLHRRGMLGPARERFEQAFGIREALAPSSIDVAASLNNLGVVARDRGDFVKAKKFFERALHIDGQLAPGSLSEASVFGNLGELAQEQGEYDLAMSYHLKALAIRKKLAPGGYLEAETSHSLGLVCLARSQVELAARYFSRATQSLEEQVWKLGGPHDVRDRFRAKYGDYHQDFLEIQLELGNSESAFNILERSRARGFLEQLTERDIAFRIDIPENLDRERRSIAVRFDSTQLELAGLNSRDHAEQIEQALQKLRSLREEAADVAEMIRRASPRLAALQYPRPLDVSGARQALDPGTLLLSFSVGKEQTVLFGLSRVAGLRSEILPLGEDGLRTQVKRLRELIRESRSDSPLSARRLRDLKAVSRELYAALFQSVDEWIALSERLLILPDGPLHGLPFGALVREDVNDGHDSYLVEWKPLHVALSATVYAELKQRREGDSKNEKVENTFRFVGFGDPRYPQSHAVDTGPVSKASHLDDDIFRKITERGIFDWSALPYSRHEVESIAKLFPEGAARTFLGVEALEERIKSLELQQEVLHIAAHGRVDENLPSSSFIALTIPDELDSDRDNGLLQMWEIFESVRVNADLVTLSACGSGLGKELGGEGLIGLTRAFQYAGARSVAASLWSVADQTTAELMIRFYRHLGMGLAKDEALRAAQLEFIRGPIEVTDVDGKKAMVGASAPYYWAAFQVYGDWQ